MSEVSGERVKILLVDDRQGNLLALAGILDRPDYELVLASSGEEALRHVLRQDFAVILLDVSMPQMDGFETAALIKQRSRSSLTPIIFVTASVHDVENLARGYSAGAVDYLRKPLDAFAVKAKVAVFVELFLQRRQIERQAALIRESEQRSRELEFTRLRLASEARYRSRLSTQYAVVSLLAAGRSIDEVAPKMLEVIGENLEWDLGALWLPDGDGGLTPRFVWSTEQAASVAERTRASRLEPGEGLPGQALETRELIVRNDVQLGLGEHDGGGTGLWCPVFCGDTPFAVVELLSEVRHSEDSVTTLATLCAQLGLFAQRASAAEALRGSEERLSTTLHSIGDAVIATDEKGEVRFMNPVAESLTGWVLAEAKGKKLEEVFSLVDERTGRAADGLRPRALRLGTLAPNAPAALVRKDGAWLSVEANLSGIRRGEGALLGGVVVFRDVTERRREAERRRLLAEASAALYRSLDYQETLESLAHLAVPSLGDWCVIQTREGPGKPPRTLAVAHADPEKLDVLWALGRHLEGPASPEDPLRRALEHAEPVVVREVPEGWVEGLSESPEERELYLSLGLGSMLCVPLLAHGRVLGVLAFGRAAGLRRYHHAELQVAEELAGRAAIAIDNALLYTEARRSVQLRDEFLSIASHELRTPLSSLQLHLQSLRRAIGEAGDESLSTRLVSKLDNSLKQTGRLARLVDSLLDVSRITSGRLQLQHEPFELSELVREVIDRIRDDAARAGCQLSLTADGPVRGVWDRLRVEQVVVNLLSNAIKYAAGRPIEVQVGMRDGEARISVRDHGIGIPEEDISRIFGLFERAVSIRHYGGLGLGLYIVRQIVDSHGGHIEVESEPDAGSTFTVTLPLQPPVTAEAEAPAPVA